MSKGEGTETFSADLTRSLMFSKSANALSLSSLGPSLSVFMRGSGLPRGS